LYETYFDSGEAKLLYVYDEDEYAVLAAIKRRIQKLDGCNMCPQGWRDLVNDRDEQNVMTDHDIFRVKRKAAYLDGSR
jgi:hypothetical protein